MANEVKVGILAVVSIVLFVWGVYFLKGNNLLKSSTSIYVIYESVEGLTKSAPVQVNGYKVGMVSSMYLKEDNSGKIIAVVDLTSKMKIPKNSVAEINVGVLGGAVVALKFDTPCSNGDCLVPGDTLMGTTPGMFGAVTKEIDPYLKKLEVVMEKADSLFKDVTNDTKSGIGKTFSEVEGTISNLNQASSKLNRMLSKYDGEVGSILTSVNGITNNLDQQKGNINTSMANLTSLTNRMSKLDFEKSFKDVNTLMADLKGSLAEANGALKKLTGTLGEATDGTGTIDKLLQDEELYNKLNATLDNVNKLAKDFEEKPYRYMPFKSRKKVLRNDKKDGKVTNE